MADVEITPQAISPAGIAQTYTTLNATDTYYVPNRGSRVMLHFKNTNASPATVTLDITQTTAEGLGITDPTISVPATTGDKMAGTFPFVYEVRGGANDGKLKFTQTVATGMSVAAIQT